MDATATPIACSLSPNLMHGRLEEFRSLFAGHLVGLERETPGRLLLTLGDADVTAMADLFTRERECCPFWTFDVVTVAASVVVSVAVPEGAQPTLDGFEALAREAAARVATSP